MNVNYLCVTVAYYKIGKGFGKGGVNVESEAWEIMIQMTNKLPIKPILLDFQSFKPRKKGIREHW